MARELGTPEPAVKQPAAALSIISSSSLILLTVVAGPITGAVAILTGFGIVVVAPGAPRSRAPGRRAG